MRLACRIGAGWPPGQRDVGGWEDGHFGAERFWGVSGSLIRCGVRRHCQVRLLPGLWVVVVTFGFGVCDG